MFYFLMLNLVYMGVQMGYGVATNSLGLISDGRSRPFAELGELTDSHSHGFRLPRYRSGTMGFGSGNMETGCAIYIRLH